VGYRFIPVGVGRLWEGFLTSSQLATPNPCRGGKPVGSFLCGFSIDYPRPLSGWEACGKPFLRLLNWVLQTPVGVGSLWEAFFTTSRLATPDPCRGGKPVGSPFYEFLIGYS
jgi:hypothetical protein